MILQFTHCGKAFFAHFALKFRVRLLVLISHAVKAERFTTDLARVGNFRMGRHHVRELGTIVGESLWAVITFKGTRFLALTAYRTN